MGCSRVTGGDLCSGFHVFRCARLRIWTVCETDSVSGAVSIFIAAAAPNRASLGATNGLAQLSVSILRAVGPALVGSMYSLSIDENHHYMNGGLVYYVVVMVGIGATWAGSLLPKRPFKDMK